MACDEGLVQRMREHLDDANDVEEKRMFGGVAFFVDGNMGVGVHKEFLIVRLSAEDGARGLAKPHVREFDITGKAMKGWLMVEPKGVERDKDLRRWVDLGIQHARSLPPKLVKPKPTKTAKPSKPAKPSKEATPAKPAKPKAVMAAKAKATSGKTIAGYIEGLGDWRSEVVLALCELVRAAAPKATESIKWGQPVFEDNGPFCYVKAFKSHVNFGFWRGTELSDPKGLLQGSGEKMGHVRIAAASDIKKGALSALVREAVKLNRQLGDPSRR